MSGNLWMTDVQKKVGAVADRYTSSDLPVLLEIGPRLVPMDIESVRVEPWDRNMWPALVVKIKNFSDGTLDTDGGDMIQYGAKA